jgi:hypothetical protein
MEPSPETFIEIGMLCAAWSHLEAVSETTAWGVLDADERLGAIITWRLDLRLRWQLILEHAPKKHQQADIDMLRQINKDLVIVTRDRNIVVHGIIHAEIEMTGPKPEYGTRLPHDDSHKLTRPPCWTIFCGAEAGRIFPDFDKSGLNHQGQHRCNRTTRTDFQQGP